MNSPPTASPATSASSASAPIRPTDPSSTSAGPISLAGARLRQRGDWGHRPLEQRERESDHAGHSIEWRSVFLRRHRPDGLEGPRVAEDRLGERLGDALRYFSVFSRLPSPSWLMKAISASTLGIPAPMRTTNGACLTPRSRSAVLCGRSARTPSSPGRRSARSRDSSRLLPA
jgi:hypothetical protein